MAGPLIQCLGPGLVMPVMLARMYVSKQDTKSPPQFDMGSFALSIVIGYLVPLVFAALPAPAVIAYRTKQQLIATWQGWPLYTSLLLETSRLMRHKQSTRRQDLKRACRFALACSTAGHLIFWWQAMSGTHTGYAATLTGSKFYQAYLPPVPWREPQMTSVERGILRFLQWDYTISASALLVWVAAVHRQIAQQGNRHYSWASSIGGIIGAILLGPCSVATVLYWESLKMEG